MYQLLLRRTAENRVENARAPPPPHRIFTRIRVFRVERFGVIRFMAEIDSFSISRYDLLNGQSLRFLNS